MSCRRRSINCCSSVCGADGFSRQRGLTTWPNLARTLASMGSVLARIPTPFAKSRTWRGLAIATRCPRSSNSAMTSRSYPPEPSRVIKQVPDVGNKPRSFLIPSRSLTTRNGLASGAKAISKASLETSIPTNVKSFMNMSLPCQSGLERAFGTTRCKRLFGFDSRGRPRSRWAAEWLSPRVDRSAASRLSWSTTASEQARFKLVVCVMANGWQVSGLGFSPPPAVVRPAALRLAGARLRFAGRTTAGVLSPSGTAVSLPASSISPTYKGRAAHPAFRILQKSLIAANQTPKKQGR